MMESPIALTLRRMNLVYLAQVAAMMIFGLIALYVRNLQPIDNELAKLLRLILIGLLVSGLMGAQFIPGMLNSRIAKTLELKDKLSKYFQVVIVRSAFLEAPGLFAGVATLLTGRSYFMIVVAILLVAFYFYRPTSERISADLALNTPERRQLEAAMHG
jgi:hypothetical protein